MDFKIKLHDKNTFPIKGLLIKNPSVVLWVKSIQELQLPLSSIQVYPIPDDKVNTIWGCLIVFQSTIERNFTSRHELCQLVSTNLFIPERSVVSPAMSEKEIQKLFSSGVHIIHPEFGLVELSEPIDFHELLITPVERPIQITRPHDGIFIPKEIRSFQVQSTPQQDVLKNLEENIFPKHEKMKDESLTVWEKTKLGFYRFIFTAKQEAEKTISSSQETSLGEKLKMFFDRIFKSGPKWSQLQQDFEDLEGRNQKEIDKLMNLLKNNPEEALKYAIPLDGDGITRGGAAARFDLSKRWTDFSLFKNNGNGTNGSINLGDHFHTLHNQYQATALELVQKKDYHKAAFVYMKLLKNYSQAAEALELGEYYQEAATIYLKHGHNKLKAAQCYEKGNFITEAIDLYKTLNDNEKVGDLYMRISNQRQAMVYYEKVVENYKINHQYIKASAVYIGKMKDPIAGQGSLLEGWNMNKDAVNCLRTYFSNIQDTDLLWKEISTICSTKVADNNHESFIHVLKYEYRKKNELADSVKDMAYEVVAAFVHKNPSIVSELKDFNPNNTELRKDTLRYKLKSKK